MNPSELSRLRFPVQYLEITEAVVRARHGRVADVRAACGVAPAGEPGSDWIDGHQLQASLDLAVAHCLPGEAPALQILRHFPLTAHGTLGMLAITSGTVGEALEAALQYHALVMPLFEMRRQPDGNDGVRVHVRPTVDFAPHNELMAELVIGVMRNVAPYTATRQPVLHAAFAHAARWPLQDYTDFLGVAPRFGAPVHGFTVPHALLATPLITGNRATRATLQGQLQREVSSGASLAPVTHQLRHHLLAALRRGHLLSSEHLAHELAMSVRTLSRRLQDEGTSLTQVMAQLRMEHAEHLLGDARLSVRDVARRTGFADASSFIRAFKRATGRTPAENRQRRPALGPH